MAKRKDGKKNFVVMLDEPLNKFSVETPQQEPDIKTSMASVIIESSVGDAVINEDKTVSVNVTVNPIIKSIKFYPPPDACETCWKKRFAEYRRILDSFALTDNNELTIEIIGDCSVRKLERLNNWLVNYLHTFYNDSIKLVYVYPSSSDKQ